MQLSCCHFWTERVGAIFGIEASRIAMPNITVELVDGVGCFAITVNKIVAIRMSDPEFTARFGMLDFDALGDFNGTQPIQCHLGISCSGRLSDSHAIIGITDIDITFVVWSNVGNSATRVYEHDP